jgi:hypothetical protein
MAAAGHRLVTPTYTGLGEREHLTNRSIDLETHIQDTLNVIRYEDLAGATESDAARYAASGCRMVDRATRRYADQVF